MNLQLMVVLLIVFTAFSCSTDDPPGSENLVGNREDLRTGNRDSQGNGAPLPGNNQGQGPNNTDGNGPNDPDPNPQNPDNPELIPFLPELAFNYSNISLPGYFNSPAIRRADNQPSFNAITDEGATLGRVLFYDQNLSLNGSVSCATCHEQSLGFADNARFSRGFDGGRTGRNSSALSNARYYQNGHFFWDERAASLEDQVLMPIQDPVEMGLSLSLLEERVRNSVFYDDLFIEAFGSSQVNSERISRALAQFVRSMVSFESRFDEGLQQGNFEIGELINGPRQFSNFTPLENSGMQLFFGRAGCNRCHQTVLFIANEATNIGLDATTRDPGIGGVSGKAEDGGKFKVPSLRNVQMTGPYMHDGRFNSLNEVIGFYNNRVQPHPNLDDRLKNQNGQPRRLNLSQRDRAALVAFLNTLTDEDFLSNEKFSNPFRNDD